VKSKTRSPKKARALTLELLLVGLIALSVGRDVSEAAGACNTQLDCHASCTQLGNGSRETLADGTHHTTGSGGPVCGTEYTFSSDDCTGSSNYTFVSCPGNCCD
jgi:hypothetical protein